MEEKDVILNLKFDTEDSLNAIEQVEQKFVDLEKQTEENGEVIAAMSKKIELYKSAAIKAGAESPIGKEAIKKAAQLQGELDKVNELVNRNNTDFDTFRSVVGISQTAINSYGAFQAVSAIAGVENEKLLETMVKLQAAQQLLNSLEGARASLLQKNSVITKGLAIAQKGYALAVGTSSGALKVFRLALIATGIGALIVGLGLLIANFKKISTWVQNLVKRFEFLQKFVAPLIWIFDKVKEGLQALGIIDDEETARAKKNAEERIENAKKEEEAINSKYDFEISKAQAAGKKTFELEKLKREALIARIREEAKAIVALARLNGEVTDEMKERAKELKDEFIKLKREQVVENIKEEKKLTDEFKKEVDKRKQEGDKAAQEEAKLLQEKQNREDEQFKLLEELRLSAQEKEISDLVRQYDEKFKLAEGNAELEKELAIKQGEEIKAIEQSYADEKLKAEAEQSARMRDLRMQLKEANAGEIDDKSSPEEVRAYYEQRREIENENFLNQLEDLKVRAEQENLTQEEINLNKELIERQHSNNSSKIKKDELDFENKINKAKVQGVADTVSITASILDSLAKLGVENAELQKAVAIAQIAIDTGRGISAAVAAGAGVPYPGNIPAILSGVSAVLGGIVNAKAALSAAKIPGGTGITVPNIPGTSGGGGGFAQPETGNTFEAPQGTFTGFGLPETPTQVTVLESDIQRAAERNKQSVQTSEL